MISPVAAEYTLKTKQNVYAARYNAEAGCFESVANGTWSNGGTIVLGASTAEGVTTFEKGLGMMAKGVGAEMPPTRWLIWLTTTTVRWMIICI